MQITIKMRHALMAASAGLAAASAVIPTDGMDSPLTWVLAGTTGLMAGIEYWKSYGNNSNS